MYKIWQSLPLTAIDVESLHVCQTCIFIGISAYNIDVSVFHFVKAAETSAAGQQGAAQFDCHCLQVPFLHLRTNCIGSLLNRWATENKYNRLAQSDVDSAAEVQVFLDLTTGGFIRWERLPAMLLALVS